MDWLGIVHGSRLVSIPSTTQGNKGGHRPLQNSSARDRTVLDHCLCFSKSARRISVKHGSFNMSKRPHIGKTRYPPRQLPYCENTHTHQSGQQAQFALSQTHSRRLEMSEYTGASRTHVDSNKVYKIFPGCITWRY